ncbi:MAG: methyl-accepting chemotaxis protein [Clostridiales bacterium]|jgi:methyl-accepting chemotaxis protein|nr:methyl-accepting chemotaxis protein [Clostridiales bacterium]
MRNFKISSKLYFILLFTIIATLIISITNIFISNNLSNNSIEISAVVVNPLRKLTALERNFSLMRIQVRDIILNTDKEALLQDQNDIAEAYKQLNTITGEYEALLRDNGMAGTEGYSVLMSFKNALPGVKAVADEIAEYGLRDEIEASTELVNEKFYPMMESLGTLLDSLSAINGARADVLAEATQQLRNSAIILTIMLSAVELLILIIVYLVIIRSIVRPINHMVEASVNLAEGRMDMNLELNAKDEIGQLAQSFSVAVASIKNILSDIDVMSVKQNDEGDIDAYIDKDRYKGAYAQVALNVNEMVAANIKLTRSVMVCINELAKGNFDVAMERMRGKKVFVNEAIDVMRANLKGVGDEIESMVREALEGNLSVRAKTQNFSGGWAEIMRRMNALLDSITKPVMESSRVLQEMAKGNLREKVTGSFKGDLARLANAVNSTIEAISLYIGDISYVLGEIANGNIDVTVDREYLGDFENIKNAMTTIITRLNDIVGNISSSTEQVAVGAKNISDSSMAMATGATEQASSVEELSATIDMINTQTRSNAENAKNANTFSENSKQNALMGNDEMGKMLTAMEGIKESSNNISRIISTIQDIASQTNLLALNAAVEAARAGVHGKGFTVVSEEVRNLSVKSQTAARETAAMIADSIARVNDGMSIANTTARSLETIVTDINEISSIISEIAAASQEQSNAISQVTIGLGQISQVVQNNSATSQETAASAQELSSQSETLSSMVSIFTLKKDKR